MGDQLNVKKSSRQQKGNQQTVHAWLSNSMRGWSDIVTAPICTDFT